MHTGNRARVILACTVALLAAVTVTMTAAATHGGLHGLFNSRGTAAELDIRDRDHGLRIKSKGPVDVAIVGAQLDAHGQTGWHTHPAESIVTVRPGGPALKMIELDDGECEERIYAPGEAFVHPAGPHNFVNTGSTALDFGVAYFVPVGAALLKPVNPAPAC